MHHWDRMTLVTNGLRGLRYDEGIDFELAERMPYTDDRIIFPDGQIISFNWSTVDAKSLCDNIRAYWHILQERALKTKREEYENVWRGAGLEAKRRIDEIQTKYSENPCKKILINSRYGSLDG